MTTSTQPLTPARPIGWGRIAAGTLAVFVVLIALALATAPPLRRLLANPAGGAAQQGVTEIVVRGDATQNHLFDPPVVQVPAGTTLTWSFADYGPNGGEAAVPHDVVFVDERSPLITTGSYSRTFDQPGTYRYVCSLHSFMEGRVEVVAE
jgi:plastocyanin